MSVLHHRCGAFPGAGKGWASLRWRLLEGLSSVVGKWCERPLKLGGMGSGQCGCVPFGCCRSRLGPCLQTSESIKPHRDCSLRDRHFSVVVNSTTFWLFQPHLIMPWKYMASSFLKLSLLVISERQIILHLTGIQDGERLREGTSLNRQGMLPAWDNSECRSEGGQNTRSSFDVWSWKSGVFTPDAGLLFPTVP